MVKVICRTVKKNVFVFPWYVQEVLKRAEKKENEYGRHSKRTGKGN